MLGQIGQNHKIQTEWDELEQILEKIIIGPSSFGRASEPRLFGNFDRNELNFITQW